MSVCLSCHPVLSCEVFRDLHGFLVSKITFEITFCFNFLSSIYKKKVTKPSKSTFTSISRVFRVNQVFFSSRGPPFLHKLQTSRPIHSRSQMHNIVCARFRFTDSPSNAARNARTQSRKQTHNMAADNKQKVYVMLLCEWLITFFICFFLLYLFIFLFICLHTFKSVV